MTEPQGHNCLFPKRKPSISLTLSTIPCFSPKITLNAPPPPPQTQVRLLVAQTNSALSCALAVATPRTTSAQSATPTLSLTSLLRTPRCSALPRAALRPGTCVSQSGPGSCSGSRAPRAPTLTPTPAGTRPGDARHAPRNSGAADPKRAAQILLLVAARSGAEQPPGATSGAQGAPRSRLGGPAGSPPRGQSGSAPGDSCGEAGGPASGPARGCGGLHAFRLIVPGCERQRGRRKGWRPPRGARQRLRTPRTASAAPRP